MSRFLVGCDTEAICLVQRRGAAASGRVGAETLAAFAPAHIWPAALRESACRNIRNPLLQVNTRQLERYEHVAVCLSAGEGRAP